MKNTIFYLIGYPGTGKYTIAKEIAALTGAVLVDNHLINNLVFSVVGAEGKAPLPAGVWPKIESIRRIVLDTIGLLGPSTYIYNIKLLLRMKKRHEATIGAPNGHAGTV
jgi:hypothetical protein